MNNEKSNKGDKTKEKWSFKDLIERLFKFSFVIRCLKMAWDAIIWIARNISAYQ